MKIQISVTNDQAGTEFGELCPPTYRYSCSEPADHVNLSPILCIEEDIFEFTVEDLSPALKSDFLTRLTHYLNDHFRHWTPGSWNSTDYQEIINKLHHQTIRDSKHYSTGALITLFKPNTEFGVDAAGIIKASLNHQDCLNLADASKENQAFASRYTRTA